MVQAKTWTLNKVIVLVLIGAFAMLVADIRSEHVDVVRHNWKAWIPIFYSGLMILVGAIGLAVWVRGGRQALLYSFALSFVVGGLGYWFHTKGHPIAGLMTVLSAWTEPVRHEDAPPAMAPLSFIGLGLLGMLACARRCQSTASLR